MFRGLEGFAVVTIPSVSETYSLLVKYIYAVHHPSRCYVRSVASSNPARVCATAALSAETMERLGTGILYRERTSRVPGDQPTSSLDMSLKLRARASTSLSAGAHMALQQHGLIMR
ncbi:hypothetical protein NHX12_024104 [Muraenolepis orangiensis]|uniref:Uncharacterized protein n=1 Tax=Muraenolepis orangiensis TaxID=630683 RepID=A0A9Q0EM35_9TELE|nr:hypothetical protein NHX12_024104 [Muraenolepis orangiensis]